MHPQMTTEDKTLTVLEQIWLKAWTEGKVVLTLRDKASRTSTRFALYNFAKKVKKAPGDYPQRVLDAVTGCQVSITGEKELTLTHRKISAIALDLAEQLGIDLLAIEQEAEDRNKALMDESFKRVMGTLEEVPAAAAEKVKAYK